MSDARPYRILIVEDKDKQRKDIIEAMTTEIEGIECVGEASQDRALKLLKHEHFDILILDVMLKPKTSAHEADRGGREIYEEVRQIQFIPIIFWTANPGLVEDVKSKLVHCVGKADHDALLNAIRETLHSRLPAIDREVYDTVREVHRTFLWEFVEKHWPAFKDDPDTLTYLLKRRISLSLREEDGEADHKRHPPARQYIIPPVSSRRMGTLFQGRVGDEDGHWLLLSPSCDLVKGREKLERATVCKALPLAEQTEVKAARKRGSTKEQEQAKKKLEALLSNNRSGQRDRYYCCPGVFELPDLLLDLAELRSVPIKDLDDTSRLRPLANLDSPHAEEVLARMIRYFGRVGTPDPDIAPLVERLRKTD